MKKIFSIALLLFFTAFVGQSVVFAATVKVAVLPFKMNAQQNLGFLQEGIQDMLGSRLSWDDKVVVIDKETVNRVAKSVTGLSGLSRVLLIGGKLKADYVVYGSLTIFGENASVDAKVADVTGMSEPISFFKQTDSIGQVIPEINKFATDINAQVFKRSLSPKFENTLPQETPRYASPNQGFIMHNQSGPVMGVAGQDSSYWRSKDVNELIVGMAFGDVNNDGRKEVVYISDREVFISQFVNGTLSVPTRVAKTRTNRYVAVDVADINNNGTDEIFVSGLTADESKISSFILEFNGSEYQEILSRSPYLYRVTQPAGEPPVLLGQKPVNDKGGLFGAPVYRMKNTGKEYIPGDMLLRGKLANVLGVTIGKLGDTEDETTIAFNNKDYIQLFNDARRVSWVGTDKLGGNIDRYLVVPKSVDSLVTVEYFPTRIRVFDTDQDGKPEVITCVNHDVAMNLVQGFRSFSKSRMQALSSDSLGLQPIWESRKLSGRISDFFMADFDDDGNVELVISLIKKDRGALLATGSASVIVAFDLVPPKR